MNHTGDGIRKGACSDWAIFAQDLAAGLTYEVSTEPVDAVDPTVYGNRIVWKDSRGGGDLYGATASLFPAPGRPRR